MQLAVSAQSLSAHHRAATARRIRHVLWLLALASIVGISAWSKTQPPAKRPALEISHNMEGPASRAL